MKGLAISLGVIVGIALLAGVFVGATSYGDMKRYLRMRSM